MNVLVTGGSGFVGSALLRRLRNEPHRAVAAVRTEPPAALEHVRYVAGTDLSAATSWDRAMADVEAVVHTAARVHVMKERASDPLSEFRRVNVDGTMNVARAAARAGVKRFIFLSSIKANGETTEEGCPFRADDQPHPVDPYGISKLEAEEALFDFGRQHGMDITVIRPVLIYGPGVKANFENLMKLLERRVPLPLGLIGARRSLVAVDNLVDLIVRCLDHPAAADRVFLVSDDEDLTVTEMARQLSAALGRRPRLIPIPPRILHLAAAGLGKQALAQRLFKALQVDIRPTRELLGWKPPVTVHEGFAMTAQSFLESRR